MDYTGHRFRAVVDWIEIEICTIRRSHVSHVRKAAAQSLELPDTAAPYVKAINPQQGGAASIFRIRIQDPQRLHDLENLITAIEPRFDGYQAPVRIAGIEIALDAYCPNLAEQTARFYRFLANPVSDNHRLYRDFKGSGRAMPNTLDRLTRHLEDGYQIGIGNATGDLFQHLYVKRTDSGGEPLPPDQHRARIETRLQGQALDHIRLDDWREFRFEQLTDHFRLRRFKDGLSERDDQLAAITQQPGQRRTRTRRGGGIRVYSRLTVADTTLNQRAKDALRELSRRWKARPKGTR